MVIESIRVAGFKSLEKTPWLEIRPLTILAGANNSGKSSLMQPVLLLKQTLEAQFDPGALKLDGPNVEVTSAEQILSRVSGVQTDQLSIGFRWSSEEVTFHFVQELGTGFRVARNVSQSKGRHFEISPAMESSSIRRWVDANLPMADPGLINKDWRIWIDRFFLEPESKVSPQKWLKMHTIHTSVIRDFVRSLFHVPGLRGSPKRRHSRAAVNGFPGLFNHYVASIIDDWQDKRRTEKLESVGSQLSQLGLTGKVATKRVSDVEIEILIGRLPRRRDNGKDDMIHLADAGSGVAQVLPVIVALETAERGQAVYLEEPEAHLHPRAQVKLAKLIIEAVNRGVFVVAETQSALFLRGIQTLVAKGKMDPSRVKAHWFQRNANTGATRVSSADFDERGAFGDWPEDFHEVSWEADRKYVDAAARVAFR